VLVLIMLALPVLYLGLHPGPVLQIFEPPVEKLINHFTQVAMLAP
jgi:NADH:ubiquinone oxidoreductase subunit 4 (subunit M)